MSERRPYTPKTDLELEALAQDMIAGRIFTSWQIDDPNPSMLTMVFMVLGFMKLEDLQWLQANNIVFFYEYLDKAGPRSINGMPSFFSVNYLNREDAAKLMTKARELAAMLEARKEAASAPAGDSPAPGAGES